MATQSVGKRRRGLGQRVEISVREVEALSESEEWAGDENKYETGGRVGRDMMRTVQRKGQH